jgi:hypothetical protein
MRLIAHLFAALLCACGSKDGASPPPPPTKLPPVEVRPPQDLGVDRLPQPIVDLPKQQSFRVLDPGKGDMVALRYAVGEGEMTTRIEMTLTSRHMDGGTWSATASLPPIRTALAVASTGSGQLRARPLAGEVVGTATPEALAYLSGWKASENRRLTIGFDARGQLGPIAFADDPTSTHSREAIDDLTQRLLSIVVPVPEDAVGVGASWRVVTILNQRPVVVKQTATYTLLARTGQGWKVGIDLQRIGEEQTITDPAVAKDAMVDLVALVRHYKGTLEVAHDRALPTGTLDIESSMHVRMQPRTGPVAEQILEDKGTVALTASH